MVIIEGRESCTGYINIEEIVELIVCVCVCVCVGVERES